MTPKKPSYYSNGGIEMSDIVNAYQLSWHRGNVLKYILRAGKKKQDSLLKDLEKARNHLDMEIERIRKTNGKPIHTSTGDDVRVRDISAARDNGVRVDVGDQPEECRSKGSKYPPAN
jgi:hypothetical protein